MLCQILRSQDTDKTTGANLDYAQVKHTQYFTLILEFKKQTEYACASEQTLTQMMQAQ